MISPDRKKPKKQRVAAAHNIIASVHGSALVWFQCARSLCNTAGVMGKRILEVLSRSA